jgi:hypothetical protein
LHVERHELTLRFAGLRVADPGWPARLEAS